MEEKEVKEEEPKIEEKPKEEVKEEPLAVIENPPEIIENIDNNNILTEQNEIINTDITTGYEETYNQGEYQEYNQTEYQNDLGNMEQLNYEGDVNVNYDEYQNTTEGYEQINENITGLQNTEVVNETQFRNSVQEAVIRQSTRDPLYTSNVLPVKVLQEKVNKVIVDSNATYLPLIYGGKKVTHVNSEESTNYNYNQDYTQNIQSQDYNQITQGQGEYYGNIQSENYNYQDIQGQGQDLTYGEYQTTSYN